LSVAARIAHWLRARGPVLLLGLLALAVLVQAMRLFWALVVPLGPVGAATASGASILPPPARSALFASVDPFFRDVGAGAAAGGTVTSLDLKLFGIRMNEASGGGSAIIAAADGVQRSIGVGEEVAPGVTLAGVGFDHVLLDHGGVREQLFLDQSGSVPPGGAPRVGEAGIVAPVGERPAPAPSGDGQLAPEMLRTGIGMTVRQEGGKVTGLIVQPQSGGAAFRAAGFRPGDVIRSVNGRAVGGAGDASALIASLKPGARVALEVERGSAVVPVSIFLSNR
jgi:general secretion pathway protein C